MKKNITVGVVVLGDIGRSPRMQYHSYSLDKEGFNVTILGYNESTVPNNLLSNVKIVNIKPPLNLSSYIPRLFHFMFKVFWNTIFLTYTLILNGRFKILLVQNPPAIPVLFVCWAYCTIFKAKLIIDWHNYAYSILSFSCGPNSLLVKVSKIYETFFGRLSDYNICVTKAMKIDLKINWKINAVTLYDRPGPTLIPFISNQEKMQLFQKLAVLYKPFELLLRCENRSALLISSTSWTEDEDFSILLEALSDYDKTESENFPSLLCAITGKGPLKYHYQKKIEETNWTKVNIQTPWLDPDDYYRLLASADLGVCLHTSSSGLDLPMKVIDMFGSSVPVCAYDYPCLSELVQHGKNGLVFENSAQLAQHLKNWFYNFPKIQEQHVRFRENVREFQANDWHQNWLENISFMFSN